ncbi:STAS domain-containing protein [Oceaniovalibus sp. ACAM 378]|jgi:anti-sigma B factor antagonist|uniref:STAS domain-containing protein n=1 Tax=Oceaniovalibus sp. ACAM 378 TaxID=2599923 RepID=UPI0011DA9EE3|nr:STAS domain-containing protein [Oceaniovalibus sp. ACAM 378]TYB89151.1 STAS domain-containing protein [Oceaniovalibus sp. ACAM 378]
MQLDTASDENLMVVTVREDRMDAAIALDFKDAMRDLTSDGPDRVILNLEQVRFLDSSGLGALIGAMKQLGNRRKLELAGLNPAVEKVFKLTRMDSIFTIHANIAVALSGSTLEIAPSAGRAHAC